METVLKAIADWIKGILTAGIMSNLSGLFDDVNTQVGNIAQQVGTKPSSFEPRVFAMIEALSRNVVLPIAGVILTFIACYELIQMITEHNNMAQFEPALILRWIFKTAISVWMISNTFDIIMAVFDLTQKVVSDSSGIIAGNTRVNDIGLSMLEASLMQMDVGPLFGLFLQSFFIGITMRILSMLEKAIVLCLLNTGVRRGELAGLTWKDVNFRDGTIHVSKSLLVFPNYGYQLTTTKESNIRDVDVAPEFMAFLKDYHEQWKSRKKLMGASWQKNLEKKGAKYAQSLLDLRGNDFVICNDYGFPINPDSYAALVRRVGKKAGIEKIHPHMFRHTFVSILLSNPNIGVATVAAEAGHAQPSTTLAIYTQVYDRRRDEIRKQMSKELYK